MADYGLAAQIGRGGGAGGMPQQQDPQNRMMQMMQLQQLQQNMMLARDQEARQAQMAPLLIREKETDIRRSTSQADTAREAAALAQMQREDAERARRINRGMLDVMDLSDRGQLDLSKPDTLRSISDPEVRMAVQERLTQARKSMSEAEKARLDMDSVKRAETYQFLDRVGDGITGPRQYTAAYRKLLSVSPEAEQFLSDNYNPDNAKRLRDFVRTKKTSIHMINGVPVMVTEGSPEALELGITPFGGANRPSPAAGFGGITTAQPGAAASPEMAARMAAGTPVDVGATQGAFGQRLPAAGEAGFAPVAPAQPQTMPASQFIEQRQAAPKPLSSKEVTKLRNDIADDFKSATSTIDQMQGVLDAAKEVVNLPQSTKEWIAGWTGYLPSYQAETRTGDVKLANLKGKVTQLGRAAASLSGSIGSMAVQEWRIVSDMIASLDEKGMNPADLDRQMALIEAQAQGTINRIRDAYQRQYSEEFERFGDRFKLPTPRSAGGGAAGAKDGVDTSNPLLGGKRQ